MTSLPAHHGIRQVRPGSRLMAACDALTATHGPAHSVLPSACARTYAWQGAGGNALACISLGVAHAGGGVTVRTLTVHPVCRGYGMGGLIFARALKSYRGRIITYAHRDNVESIRMCIKAGFRIYGYENCFVSLERLPRGRRTPGASGTNTVAGGRRDAKASG